LTSGPEIAMNFPAHISLETLVDIADDRATFEAPEYALAHLSRCSVCADTLGRLKQVILMMRSDTSEDVPRDVLISALSLCSRETKSALRRIVAVLTFDSRNASAALGMRSLNTASRQMLYSAEDTDVDLRIAVQNDECILAGQVIRNGCLGGRVRVEGITGSAETSLNELCEFTLPAVPVGNYSLLVKLPDIEIEIPELELKA
jgi:hypothetical protein